MKRTLEKVAHNYDWIIIDTSPSLSNLKVQTLNVDLDGNTYLLIPMQTERFGYDSVFKFTDTLKEIREYTNPNLVILGIVPTLTDTNMKVDQNILDEARELFGELLFNTVVKRRSELKKMVNSGFTEHYAKQREALTDFYELLNEVKERV